MITTFKALFIALIKSCTAGLIGTLIAYFLFLDFYKTIYFGPLEFIGMILFNLVLSFAFCGVVLFPISIMEKESNKNVPAEVLFRHYLPFITLPLFTVFCLLLFSYDKSGTYRDNDYYFCLKALIAAFCIGINGLWTFFKNKRS
jgi:hypothetical protein